MHPVHFQFITTPPPLGQYTIDRLFALLDQFNPERRNAILSAAYICYTLGDNSGYSPETAKEDMYRDFKKAFTDHTMLQRLADEDDSRWRDGYVVYGLICYLLVEALRNCERDVYEGFRGNNQEQLKQFEEAMQGDDTARQRAMQWSAKGVKQMDRIYVAKFMRRLAYRQFCEQVVEPLLKGPETD